MESVKELFTRDKLLPVMGPCMLVFSIPLSLTGLTLTLVPFSDETGFSIYSPLHVLGILMLAISGLLLVLGCLVKFTVGKTTGRVSPADDEDDLSSLERSEVVGHVHSTHAAKSHDLKVSAAASTVENKEPRSLSDFFENDAQPPQHLPPPPPAVFGQYSRESSEREKSSAANSGHPQRPLPVPLSAAVEPGAERAIPGKRKENSSRPNRRDGEHSPRHDVETRPPHGGGGGGVRHNGGGGCNFMESDSEAERVEAEKYECAARTLPRDKRGRVRNQSTLTSPSTSSASSSPHSLYESFDVEQGRAENEHGSASALPNDSREHTTAGRSLGTDATKAGLDEVQSQTIRDSHAPRADENERFFVRRRETGDDLSGESARLTNSDHGMTSDKTDMTRFLPKLPSPSRTLISSTEQGSSSESHSPSHGSYTVQSIPSEEHLALHSESFAGSVDEKNKELYESGIYPATRPPKIVRPLSPILTVGNDLSNSPLSPKFELTDRATANLSEPSGGSRKHKDRLGSDNSEYGVNARTDASLEQQSDGVEKSPKHKKKKKKKKKKKTLREKKAADSEQPQDGRFEPEEVARDPHELEESQPRSIMHPHPHLEDHHVHWSNDDNDN